MKHRIRAISGPTSGSVHLLGQCTTIGRSGETDVQVLAKGVSREHAYVIRDDRGTMVLVDMSSKNGTLVGGEAIKRHDLERGDVFKIGDAEFVYELVEEDANDEAIDLKLLSGPANALTDPDEDAGASEETVDLRSLQPGKRRD